MKLHRAKTEHSHDFHATRFLDVVVKQVTIIWTGIAVLYVFVFVCDGGVGTLYELA